MSVPTYADDAVTLYQGDCMDVLAEVEPGSVDLVLTDPPYGITSNKWDADFDLAAWWALITRAMTETAAAVLCAGQPFTSRLVASNFEMFRHEWVWIKNRGSNFANTVREPMKEHESVVVFGRGKWAYNPQPQSRTGGGEDRVQYGVAFRSESENYHEFAGRGPQMLPTERVPSSWQKWNTEVGRHPTQKPLPMMSYFVRTYSQPSDTVLDPFAGSGTTLRAAKDLGRRAVGIEREPDYCSVIVDRLAQDCFDLGEAA